MTEKKHEYLMTTSTLTKRFLATLTHCSCTCNTEKTNSESHLQVSLQAVLPLLIPLSYSPIETKVNMNILCTPLNP